jgi:CRISPR-associated protein Csm4
MNYWKLRLTPRSLQLTPWHADTFFGSLCWALIYREGEEALQRFLRPFIEGDPPFLLSDGFPTGYLPVPCFFKVRHPKNEDSAAYARNKQLKRVHYILESSFAALCSGGALSIPESPQTLIKQQSQLHCTIDRVSGTTTGKEDNATMSLFSVDGWVPGNPPGSLHLYLAERHSGCIERLIPLFRDMAKTGFGKKKSAGMGQFDMESDPEPWKPDLPTSPNGFVSLSGFVPAQADPTQGFWQILVKHGKLGEAFATGGRPFKKPWIQLLPGSCFYTESPPTDCYGRMLKGLSDAYPEVVQYGYAFPYPVHFTALDQNKLQLCG